MRKTTPAPSNLYSGRRYVPAAPIRYHNMAGEKHQQPLGALLQHFFNHQIHHRGQVTTLLFQAGVDPKATDFIMMLMEDTDKVL